MIRRLSVPIRTRIAGARQAQATATFDEVTGEVCDAICRSDTRRDRAQLSALAAGLPLF
ncbi:hypothetical protein [Microtetraspora malaysiensis]|uniref:hypothetical protein n=1 Tax=Microtetraspora malaysiensis TaxID=161358 RepID=UPI000A770811|nr:hypothetical protein [Microtetraspora malaysiensis]